MTNIAQAISHLSYFLEGCNVAFSRNHHNWQLWGSWCLCPLMQLLVSLFFPQHEKQEITGLPSVFWSRGDGEAIFPEEVMFWDHRRPEEWVGSFFIHFSCWNGWGGKSIPFIVAQCSHPLLGASSGTGVGGRKLIPQYQPALIADSKILLLLSEDFSSLVLKVTFWEVPSSRPSQ